MTDLRPPPGRSAGADASVIAGLTVVARLSGVGRVLVVGAVLGRGSLGDLYQTMNTVPNLLFELFAGGALHAVLVPALVAAHDRDGEAGLLRSTSAVAGVLGAVLGGLALVAALAAPALAWLLTRAEPDADVAGDKWRLGTWMLVIFLPQLLWYGLGMVATAALAARRRFGAAAVAPLVNNLVVIGAYLVFDRMRGDRPPALDLSVAELAVLAGGTTLAVVALTAVPAVVLLRRGGLVRPRLVRTDPAVVALRHTGGWAVLQVAATLSLQIVMLVIGNGAPGGVALFTWGLTFFLVPTALVAAPYATALAPRLASAVHRGRLAAELPALRRAVGVVVGSSAVAALAMGALAGPVVGILPLGELASGGLAPVTRTLQAFAPGMIGYGATILFTRLLFSMGEVRGAAVDTTVAAGIGAIAMIVAAEAAPAAQRAAALAGGYGVAFTAAALLLGRRLWTRTAVARCG